METTPSSSHLLLQDVHKHLLKHSVQQKQQIWISSLWHGGGVVIRISWPVSCSYPTDLSPHAGIWSFRPEPPAVTSGLRITHHTQRNSGLCFCFVMCTAAAKPAEKWYYDTPQTVFTTSGLLDPPGVIVCPALINSTCALPCLVTCMWCLW